MLRVDDRIHRLRFLKLIRMVKSMVNTSKGRDKQGMIQKIIEASGNDLQFKVAEYLESCGWEISLSPYYNDPATGKPREADIIAIRKWPINDSLSHRQLSELTIRLFIECKNIPNPVVFWFKSKNMVSAIELAKNNSILSSKSDDYLNQDQIPARHHYADNVPVAKIAARGGRADDIFDALNQCLSGLIFFRHHHNLHTYHHIDFPLIITDSLQNLYKRDPDTGSALITKPFQYEIDYSYKQSNSDGSSVDKTEYFLIDIVSFENLERFLHDLENRDIKLFRETLHWDIERSNRNRGSSNSSIFNKL